MQNFKSQIYVNVCSVECIVYNLAVHCSIYSQCKVWNYKAFFFHKYNVLKCASSNPLNIECKDQNKRFILNTDIGYFFTKHNVLFPNQGILSPHPHQLNLKFFRFSSLKFATGLKFFTLYPQFECQTKVLHLRIVSLKHSSTKVLKCNMRVEIQKIFHIHVKILYIRLKGL